MFSNDNHAEPQEQNSNDSGIPGVPKEDVDKMIENLKRFQQCMSLGKYAAAQMVLNEHREDVQRWFPETDPAWLSVDNNQGLLYKLDGNFTEAKSLFEKVLPQYEQLYGEVNIKVINVMINLGQVLKDLKQYDEAIEVFERAIKGRLETEGETSPGYAMAKAMASGAYRDNGDFTTAEAYLRDAYLQISLDHGEENATAAAILNSWGLLYKKQGKFQRALETYQRSLTLRETLFGEDHPETNATRHNIGEIHNDMGNPEKAMEMFKQNMALMEKMTEQERKDCEGAQKDIKNPMI